MADNAAYDLSLFEAVPIKHSAVAPARTPQRQQPVKKAAVPMRVVKTGHEPKQIRREAINSAIHAVRVFGTAIVVMALFGAILFSRVNLTKLEQKESEYKTMVSEAQSENTRLMMLLNSSISREKVESYAVNVLGMQKLERCQIRYFENRDADEVVICSGEEIAGSDASATPAS